MSWEAGQLTIFHKPRKADMELQLVVQASSTVVNVTFTLKYLKVSDQRLYRILVETKAFQKEHKYTKLNVLGEFLYVVIYANCFSSYNVLLKRKLATERQDM